MILPSSNGHAFEYADGTPFFLLGDTWWATPTFRFRWYDDDEPRPLGSAAGFKDYVRFRRNQQFNCIAMIAAFPNWANDGKPAGWKAEDGMVLRSAWPQAGTNSAKNMSDEAGQRAFGFPGLVPGYEEYFPNLNRIQPEYFRSLDRKIDYLNAHGMVPFIEVARRDIGQVWKGHYPWPDSYTRYIEYVWSRYQANICLFSPIHFDTPRKALPQTTGTRRRTWFLEVRPAAVQHALRHQREPLVAAELGAHRSSAMAWFSSDREPPYARRLPLSYRGLPCQAAGTRHQR